MHNYGYTTPEEKKSKRKQYQEQPRNCEYCLGKEVEKQEKQTHSLPMKKKKRDRSDREWGYPHFGSAGERFDIVEDINYGGYPHCALPQIAAV